MKMAGKLIILFTIYHWVGELLVSEKLFLDNFQ